PSYAVKAEAYAKTQTSFNYENTPLEIEYYADQVISSGEGAWWYSGFILSNDTTMSHQTSGGGHYAPDNGIAIRQPLNGYGSAGAAIDVDSYVDTSSTSVYYTSDNPGSHKFNLIVDNENVTVYVDDVMVAENVEHNITGYDSYIYFLRASDQYIWNTQKWDYVIVRQHATDEPTYTISENIEEISFSNKKVISILPSSSGTLTDYQMSFNITYEPEMQTDFDDIRFTDKKNTPLPYWMESITNSNSAKVWVKVPEINAISGATIKMYYGNSAVESESNGNDVFEFFDDFSSSLDPDKWTTVYNTPNGGSCDVTTEDGKLKVSVRGPSYAVKAEAYAKTQTSFNYENTPLEIEYYADQVISSGEGAWWYSGFILSNDTTMSHQTSGGGHYAPDNGIAIRQPLNGYGSAGAAIDVDSYVDTSSTSVYYTSDNPGSHKFNLIVDNENVTVYVDDVMVAENVEHNITGYDSYIYFLRASDQYIWNTQKWDYVIVRQHATDEPTYTISENIEEISFSNEGRVTFTYDSLGRKIAMNDPDMGNWTYEYDLNGNLINQTDARGISTLLSYDALDRFTAIDYPNDEDVSFTYDLEYNGTLSRVTKGAISSIYDYDDRYRVEGETIGYVPGTSGYTTSYEYDSMDRPTTITYPDGNSVDLTYNAQTLLESVEGVVDNLDYNARNQITTKELSNGVVTSYTYDAEKLLLDRIYTESLQDLNYEFDNVGNILEIEDNVMNSVKTYGYDDLDRLTSADMSVNSVSTYQRDFSYDQYGCIQQVDENSITISSYEYNLTPFHAPDTYNGNILDYDDNGNLVEDEDFIYVYNDANQLSEVRYSSNSSLVEKYWYDANGQRGKKQNSAGEFTYYVNQFYEIENGTATSYFFRDAERIAKQTDEGMEWYLSDHLGSTTLLVNESGLEVERTEYYPYGEVQSGGLEKYGFTGQENDIDTELMYYGARYYSPEYRIFVQPDTMLPDPYNPQALNRYAYTLNNPVKYNDPSGHFVETIPDAAWLIPSAILLALDPSPENKAFFCADVAALLIPGVPSTWIVRWPKAVKLLEATQGFLRISKELSGEERFLFNAYKFNRNYFLSTGTGLVIDGIDDKFYSQDKNSEFLQDNFNGNVPDSFNFDECYRLRYVAENGQMVSTFGKGDFYLYGFNSDKTKSLWINMVTNEINIEPMEENNDEEDNED
ncbi:Rhs family protein, partial [Methanolobus tindarius DSM 2278]